MLANPFKRERTSQASQATLRSLSSPQLRDALTAALAQRRHADALDLIRRLESLEPTDPRWPHKCGDVQRAAGKRRDAASAYRRAAKCYGERGFPARAAAMIALASSLAPRRMESADFSDDMITGLTT